MNGGNKATPRPFTDARFGEEDAAARGRRRHVVATQEQDMVAEVMRITSGNGARVAFDPVRGPDFPKLIAALTNQGIAYIYGALSEGDTPMPVLEMIRKMPTVKGYSIRLVTGDGGND
jgi:NADPH:quinone reductase-like Zn-dependent oxidoreductase